MKITLKLALLLLVMASCSSDRYLLNNDEPDRMFLSDFISELAARGEISKHPMLVIDGKPKRWGVELKEQKLSLKREQIAEIERMEKKAAIELYGEPAHKGVVLITTKQKVYDDNLPFDKYKVLYFLDDQKISLQDLQKIDPNSIKSITVIKNKDDMKSYTEEREKYDGVVIVNTK